jgi:hypothetical protein
MHAAFEGLLPDGWEGGLPVTKYWNGDYIHLYHVTRPCTSCGAVIGLDVSKKALQGTSKNSGLLLRNCPKCRAERKAGGPGSRGGTSRPQVTGAAPDVASENVDELETLRTANKTMKEELKDLYASRTEMHAELQVLKAKLATHELQFGMQALSETKPLPRSAEPTFNGAKVVTLPPEPLTMAQSTAALKLHDTIGQQLLQKFLENKKKMPWDSQ